VGEESFEREGGREESNANSATTKLFAVTVTLSIWVYEGKEGRRGATAVGDSARFQSVNYN